MSKFPRLVPALIFALLLLGGCATAPTPDQIAQADYGEPVTQEFAQEVAKSHFESILKDPFSAQYKWGNIEKAWYQQSRIEGGGVFYGYRLVVDVNAKNSYGGYTGYQSYAFFFRSGRLIQVLQYNAALGGWF